MMEPSPATTRLHTHGTVTRPGVRMLALASAAVALTGCQASSDETRPNDTGVAPVSVLLDWSPNPDHVALYTAQHTGAYDDAGVDVEFTTPSNTADAAREVSLGRVDLAISYEPDTLIAVEQGLEIISVAALIPTSLNSLIAKKESGITTAADLEHKTVGVSGLASQEPTLDFIAREAGVEPDSISTPNVQQSLNQALLTNQVDAIFGAYRNIEGVELGAQGDVVIMPATELGVPDYAELVVIANPGRLRDDTDYAERVRGFLTGTEAGQESALADPRAAIDALTPQTEDSYDPDVLVQMIDATLALLPRDGFEEQSARDWAAYASWMHENGLLDNAIDGATATTNDYLPGAGG